MKIRDGSATVTGYKFPKPLFAQAGGKAGIRFEARSQDIGPAALVMAPLVRSCFSASEKDEARLPRENAAATVLSAFIHRFAEFEGIFILRSSNSRAGLSLENMSLGDATWGTKTENKNDQNLLDVAGASRRMGLKPKRGKPVCCRSGFV